MDLVTPMLGQLEIVPGLVFEVEKGNKYYRQQLLF
jgi:hypothetical protein